MREKPLNIPCEFPSPVHEAASPQPGRASRIKLSSVSWEKRLQRGTELWEGGTRGDSEIRRPNGVWRGCILNLSNPDIWGSFIFSFKNSADPSELYNGICLPNVIKADLTDLSFWWCNLLKIFKEIRTGFKQQRGKSLFKYKTGLETAIPTN